MAQPMIQMSNHAMRDARKWARWSWKRRTLKRLMDPQRAREMEQAAFLAQQFVPVQPQRREPAFWHASEHIKGL